MVLTKLFPDLAMPSSLGPTTVINDGILPIAMAGPWVAGLVAVPVVIACYLMVWLTFHSMHVIALVSPFGIIDTGLKISRLGLVGAILLLSFASPLLGVLLCALIILISYFVSGWSFRLLVFGSILSWDLMLFRHRRVRPDEEDLIAQGFLCSAVDVAPARSYGTLSRDPSGSYHFRYRPWLIWPEQSVPLPATELSIQRGILSPIARGHATGLGSTHLVRLRPKYRGHEELLARHLGTSEIEDHIISRGFHHARNWLREWCRPTVAPA